MICTFSRRLIELKWFYWLYQWNLSNDSKACRKVFKDDSYWIFVVKTRKTLYFTRNGTLFDRQTHLQTTIRSGLYFIFIDFSWATQHCHDKTLKKNAVARILSLRLLLFRLINEKRSSMILRINNAMISSKRRKIQIKMVNLRYQLE